MKISYLLVAAIISLHLSALDPQAKKIIDSIREQMKEMPLPDYELSFEEKSPEELEAYIEQGEKRVKEKKWTQEEIQFVDLMKPLPQEYKFEGDEAEFHPEILANPLEYLGIVDSKETPARKEVVQNRCVESADYNRQFVERLQVTLLPEVKKVKQCAGHHIITKVSVKNVKGKERAKIADQKVRELKQGLEKDSTVQASSVRKAEDRHETHIDIILDYNHLDDVPGCDHYQMIEVSETVVEKEEWVADEPEKLAAVKDNPNCRLAFIDIQEGSQSRWIDGKEVFREVWARNLLFRCAPNAHSLCAKYRKEGGQLVKKQCIQRNEETGDCEMWEKIYETVNSHPAETDFTYAEGSKKIWGMNGELRPEPTTQKDASLTQLIGFMKSISDMPLGEGKKLYDLDGKMAIFNGTVHKCHCNHFMKEYSDCCKEMTGIRETTGIRPCSEEEWELRKLQDEGRCHYVDHYNRGIFHHDKSRVYCCYPTKLLRIFNEQARIRMGIGWGTAEKPNCAGFSLEQMEGKFDLSSLDFSEAADDLKIDEDALLKEMIEKLQESMKNPELNLLFQKDPDAL